MSITINHQFNTLDNVGQVEEVFKNTSDPLTGTINFDVLTQSVLHYTSDATGNWTLNVRGSATRTLDSMFPYGSKSITIALMATNGATAYYQNGFQIDGANVTPKWQGGSAPTSGNPNSIDVYIFTITKNNLGSLLVLGSVTKFA